MRRRNIYVTEAPADLSIASKLTNAPSLRLLPDSVYDTASLPFYHFTPLFEPDYAAIARRNDSGANRRLWMFTQVLSAMPAFALPISVCGTPSHSRLGNMRAHEREHKEDWLWVSTHSQLSQSQEGSNTCPAQRNPPPLHHVVQSSIYPLTRKRAGDLGTMGIRAWEWKTTIACFRPPTYDLGSSFMLRGHYLALLPCY